MIKRWRKKLQLIMNRLLEIPAVQLVVRTIEALGHDDAADRAGGIAYYAILSLFPLLLGVIALLGLFLPSETVQKELFDFFKSNLPGAVGVLERNITNIIKLRGALGVLSLAGLFWSGSAMFSSISRTVNRAWGISLRQQRPFYIRKLRDLAMAVGTGILFFFSMGATAFLSILDNVELALVGTVFNFGGRFLVFLLALAIFLLIYKFIPNTRTSWGYVWPGALLAAVLFQAATGLFVLYLDRFANYELVYGSVASFIALLVWIYFSAFILVLGAEFSFEYSRMRGAAGRRGPSGVPTPEPEELE